MGANRMFSALQRLIGHREDDIASVFEFRPLGQKGVRLFSNNTVLPIVHHPGLSVKVSIAKIQMFLAENFELYIL